MKQLTAVEVAALKSKTAPYYVPDRRGDGLRIRVAPSGKKTWVVSLRVKGSKRTRSHSLGPVDLDGIRGRSLADARKRASEIARAAREGKDLIAQEEQHRVQAASEKSVQEIVERYIKSIKDPLRSGKPLKTAADSQRRLNRALSPFLSVAARSLTKGQIIEVLDEVYTKTPREAEKRRQIIGAMFKWAVAKGFLDVNPLNGSEAYGERPTRDRHLDFDEIALLWTWLNEGGGDMPPDIISTLKLQLLLGARIGEVSGMHVEELTRAGTEMTWTLPDGRSKSGRPITRPLFGPARMIVERALLHRRTGPLFRIKNGERALRADDVGHALGKRALPIEKFVTHDLRRTVISRMIELKVPQAVIAALIGHQHEEGFRTLTVHYDRANFTDEVKDALGTWFKRLEDAVGSPL